MYCYNCGKEIADSAIACVYCGKPVITEKEQEAKKKVQSPVLWILGLAFSIIFPILGVILGLAGSCNYKDEFNKKRSLSAMIIGSSMLLAEAVVFAYVFASVMQIIKPFIDTFLASIAI